MQSSVSGTAAVSELVDLVAAGGVLALTGAGISTDSGIPDYRGPDGVQRFAAPMTFERFTSSAEARRRYWARSFVGWQRIRAARPNPSHQAVAQLEHAGLITGVVTQNVDGLHRAAGSRRVVDLHGRLDTVVCLQCQTRRPRVEIALRLEAVNPGFLDAMTADATIARPDGDVVIPDDRIATFRIVDCRVCGGMLKPDVVFFGEAVPRDRFRRATDLLATSSALLVLGSSLAVGSGYRFVTLAAQRDLPVAIVNRGPTRGDKHAMLKIDAPLGDVLPDVTAAVHATP